MNVAVLTFESAAELRAALAAVKAELGAYNLPPTFSRYQREYGPLHDLYARQDALRASLAALELEWAQRWPEDYADTIAAEDRAHALAYRVQCERELASAEERLTKAKAQQHPIAKMRFLDVLAVQTAEENLASVRRRVDALKVAA